MQLLDMNILKNATAPPQASGTTLGFARGNVGFLALGDLGKDFNTGLPVIDHNNHSDELNSGSSGNIVIFMFKGSFTYYVSRRRGEGG